LLTSTEFADPVDRVTLSAKNDGLRLDLRLVVQNNVQQ
jgi:hypothetical protein